MTGLTSEQTSIGLHCVFALSENINLLLVSHQPFVRLTLNFQKSCQANGLPTSLPFYHNHQVVLGRGFCVLFIPHVSICKDKTWLVFAPSPSVDASSRTFWFSAHNLCLLKEVTLGEILFETAGYGVFSFQQKSSQQHNQHFSQFIFFCFETFQEVLPPRAAWQLLEANRKHPGAKTTLNNYR